MCFMVLLVNREIGGRLNWLQYIVSPNTSAIFSSVLQICCHLVLSTYSIAAEECPSLLSETISIWFFLLILYNSSQPEPDLVNLLM